MPLLNGTNSLNAKSKGKSTKESPKWVKLPQTEKVIHKNDVYILGHSDIKMPAIISSSTIPGVKARLVVVEPKEASTNAPPTSQVSDDNIKVLEEWEFKESNQSIPIYFSNPLHIYKTFWVEMLNPNEQDAIVNALIHGMIRSKGV